MARSQTKLSVIVPAFNEAETIALVLERVTALDLDTEIIVVDDSPPTGHWMRSRTPTCRVCGWCGIR